MGVEAIRGGFSNLVHGLHPDLHHTGVPLVLGYQSPVILAFDDGRPLFGLCQQSRLGCRHLDVAHGDGCTGLGSIAEADLLEVVHDHGHVFVAQQLGAIRHHSFQHRLVNRLVVEAELFG